MQVFLRSSLIINGRYNIIKKCCIGCNYSVHCFCKTNIRKTNHDFNLSKQLLTSSSSSINLIFNKQRPFLNPNLDVQHFTTRQFSLSSVCYEVEKPSSKVEVTVQALKDKKERSPAELPPKAVVKKTLKQRVIAEIIHYYHGFRLLAIDMKISCGLMWRILNGKTLSRREHRLLMRTVGDMFRLVPFSVFIIVPFMEFLLPVFIKFFPGMLPSTFQTAVEKEDKIKQNLKVKLEMAKFLQQTLDDMSVKHKDHSSELAKEFSDWFHKIRTSGEWVSNEEILKFSKLFQDEITLDSLSRNQLVALCRVLEVQTLGTNNLLRFQLRMKLRSLAADDKTIKREGVDALTLGEIQQACRARGIRAYGISETRLRAQLEDWLELSLNEKVPPSLLLLSRALMLPDTIPTGDKLKATISALPDVIVTQTKAAIGESEGKIDNKVQLEVIMEEERRIKEERKEEKKKDMERDLLVDKAPVLTDSTGLPTEMKDSPTPIAEKQVDKGLLNPKDLEAIEDALDTISKEKKTIVEKVEIDELKEQMADYQEDVQDLQKAISDSDLPRQEISETVAAKRLFKKVNKMITKMDHVLAELKDKEQALIKEIEVSPEETKNEELLKIEDIMTAIRQIKNVPDETRLAHIENVLGKIDDDRDGSIKIEDVLKVIEIIGKDNVQLSSKQIDELVELLDKEETLEVEDKIEKALKKEQEAKEEQKLGEKDMEENFLEKNVESNPQHSIKTNTSSSVDPKNNTNDNKPKRF